MIGRACLGGGVHPADVYITLAEDLLMVVTSAVKLATGGHG